MQCASSTTSRLVGCWRKSAWNAGSARRSGVVSTTRALPSAMARSAACSVPLSRALLTCTQAMPRSVMASHWSCIRAIKGDTTTVRPGSSVAGSW